MSGKTARRYMLWFVYSDHVSTVTITKDHAQLTCLFRILRPIICREMVARFGMRERMEDKSSARSSLLANMTLSGGILAEDILVQG